MAIFTITTENLYSARQIQLLRKLLNDPLVRIEVNTIIKDAMTPYVPSKSGALRRSAQVTPTDITWGVEGAQGYAHYQHEGITYGPNIPIHEKGNPHKIIGWYSKPGKYPNGAVTGFGILGTPGTMDGWDFGYTTDNTMSHWTDRYAYDLKRKTNLEITKRLREICRERGITT